MQKLAPTPVSSSNYLTGYSQQSEYRKLLVAPVNLSAENLTRLIERETENARAEIGPRELSRS